MLTHAFVTSRLDYCNSLLHGISKAVISRLQHVLNSAARIVSRTKMCNHITPVLKSLHWLPVQQRCAFKIAFLTFKAIHGLAPSYLSELINYRFPSHDLRSVNDVLLDVPDLLLLLDPELLLFLHLYFGIIFLVIFINLSCDIRSSMCLSSFKL